MEREAKTDRRSRRTRRLVTGAMIELLLEKPYDEITVQTILDRADIGRATFYSHFRDKLDVVDAVAAEMFEGWRGNAAAGTASGASGAMPAAELFRHAAERFASLRAMLDMPGSEVFWAESQNALASAIEESAGRSPGRMRGGVPDVVLGQFVAGAFAGVLKWWLREGMPHPPDQMAAMFETLLPAAVRETGGGAGAREGDRRR